MKRSERVSMRLTPEEDKKLCSLYRQSGFEKTSQFLRHLIFNIAVPRYMEYLKEKAISRKIRKFIFVEEGKE